MVEGVVISAGDKNNSTIHLHLAPKMAERPSMALRKLQHNAFTQM